MRYNADLAGTTWQRKITKELVNVVIDPAYHSGNPQRTIVIQQAGEPEQKIATPSRLVTHCDPFDAASRTIHGFNVTTDAAGLMQFDVDFTGTQWRNSSTGKVVQVIADPAKGTGTEKRKLWVRVVHGDTVGREHDSSPSRLWYAYEPVCPRAIRISNGEVPPRVG